MKKTEDVFGVSNKPVLSYIERPDVDTRFREAMASDKQIIVYGASKQGKTSLVGKHIPYDEHIVIRLSPNSTRIDIYSSILMKLGIQIKESETKNTGLETAVGFSAKVKAKIPIFGGGEAGAKSEVKGNSENEITYKEITANLALPNDIAELCKSVKNKKYVILENFHYLDEERQKELAVDLRNFQELSIRFVVLGVWREKNRLAQFNGDLLDRSVEIPVEPWHEPEFRRVAQRGADELNIKIASNIVDRAITASFSSIGVFQELMKQVCLIAGITQEQPAGSNVVVVDLGCLEKAITIKADEYASRHQRALEAIASGNVESSAKDGRVPLFLPYYFVKALLSLGFDGISAGMPRATLHDKIREAHHRGADVRPSDMGNLLGGLATLQARKGISPPIIDYDHSIRKIQVVDSTFYFFLRNANLEKIGEEIPNPLH
jgi:hypothetical protein